MKFFVLTFFVLISTVLSAPAKESTGPHSIYDQKQTGDYNIQVHLKDISIVALLGDELLGDYDYNYDYSDFTVKPPGGNATSKPDEPSSSTESQSTTASSSEKPVEIASPSTTSEKTTSTEKLDSVPFSTSSPDKIKVQIIEEPSVAIVPADDMGGTHAAPLGEVLQLRKCASGFTRDKRGRCRRVRRPGHQHQFDIGRLASNLASRIRGSPSGEDTLSAK